MGPIVPRIPKPLPAGARAVLGMLGVLLGLLVLTPPVGLALALVSALLAATGFYDALRRQG
jgi:hypothetical protein